METGFNVKRSVSESLPITHKIISPSPIKTTHRVSIDVLRELSDCSYDELIIQKRYHSASAVIPGRGNGKSDNESSNDSISDSLSPSLEIESPNRVTRNPFYSDHLLPEDISIEIPFRTSNPVVHDANFNQSERGSVHSYSLLNLL